MRFFSTVTRAGRSKFFDSALRQAESLTVRWSHRFVGAASLLSTRHCYLGCSFFRDLLCSRLSRSHLCSLLLCGLRNHGCLFLCLLRRTMRRKPTDSWPRLLRSIWLWAHTAMRTVWLLHRCVTSFPCLDGSCFSAAAATASSFHVILSRTMREQPTAERTQPETMATSRQNTAVRPSAS